MGNRGALVRLRMGRLFSKKDPSGRFEVDKVLEGSRKKNLRKRVLKLL